VPGSIEDKRLEWECPELGWALDLTYFSRRLWYNGTTVGGCLVAEFFVMDQILAQEMCPHQLSRDELKEHFRQLDGMPVWRVSAERRRLNATTLMIWSVRRSVFTAASVVAKFVAMWFLLTTFIARSTRFLASRRGVPGS
jgi:hypothetical protein